MSKRKKGPDLFEIMGADNNSHRVETPTPLEVPSVQAEIPAAPTETEPEPEETPTPAPVSPPPTQTLQRPVAATGAGFGNRQFTLTGNMIAIAGLALLLTLVGVFALGSWLGGDTPAATPEFAEDPPITNPNAATAAPREIAEPVATPAPVAAPTPSTVFTIVLMEWADKSAAKNMQGFLARNYGLETTLMKYRNNWALAYKRLSTKDGDDTMAALAEVRGLRHNGRYKFKSSAFIAQIR
jgi:hypothetical protein